MSEENDLGWFDEEKNDIWRITAGGRSKNRGEEWLDNDVISIGWGDVGPLSEYLTDEEEFDEDELEDAVENKKEEHDYDQRIGHIKGTLKRFYSDINEGDLVLAYKDGILYGIGEVESDYDFDPEILKEGHPHVRDVRWIDGLIPTPISKDKLRLELENGPFKVWAGSTLESFKEDYGEMVELLQNWDKRESIASSTTQKTLLENKKQVILYGPPGTGKTYNTKKISVDLLVGDGK